MFSRRTIMITGGTGSFGNAVLKRFASTDTLGKSEYFRAMKKNKTICEGAIRTQR